MWRTRVFIFASLVAMIVHFSPHQADAAPADIIAQVRLDVGKSFSFKPALSLRQHPECPDTLGRSAVLASVVEAFNQRRYADFAANLARLQRELMCLPREGARI
jgi:hypothetical protein